MNNALVLLFALFVVFSLVVVTPSAFADHSYTTPDEPLEFVLGETTTHQLEFAGSGTASDYSWLPYQLRDNDDGSLHFDDVGFTITIDDNGVLAWDPTGFDTGSYVLEFDIEEKLGSNHLAPGFPEVELKVVNPPLPAEPITDLSVSDVTSNSITLSWTEPNLNGGTLNTYEIIQGTLVHRTSATELTVQNLNPDTAYDFAVQTVTTGGKSLPSNLLRTSIASLATADPIDDLAASAITSNSITLSWTEPNLNGGTLNTYEIIQGTLVHRTSATELTVQNLNPDTAYDFAVQTVTTGGKSLPGNLLRTSTASLATADPIDDLAASAITNTGLTLSWSAPDLNGQTLDTYEVITTASDGTVLDLPGRTSETTYTVTGLSPNTGYFFAVRTMTDNGATSSPSGIISATTTAVKPSSVDDLTATNIGQTTLRLEWTQPDLHGSELGLYRITFTTPHNPPPGNSPLGTTTDTFFEVTGLNPDTEYSFRVAARTDAGFSGGNVVLDTKTLPLVATERAVSGQTDGANNHPVVDPLLDRFIKAYDEYEIITFTLNGTDADDANEVLVWSFVDNSTGTADATLNPDSGLFVWIPDSEDGGTTVQFNFTATDTNGQASDVPLTVNFEINDMTVVRTGSDRFADFVLADYSHSIFEGEPIPSLSSIVSDIGDISDGSIQYTIIDRGGITGYVEDGLNGDSGEFGIPFGFNFVGDASTSRTLNFQWQYTNSDGESDPISSTLIVKNNPQRPSLNFEVSEGGPFIDLSLYTPLSGSPSIRSATITEGSTQNSFELLPYLTRSLVRSDGSFNFDALPSGTNGIPFPLNPAGDTSLIPPVIVNSADDRIVFDLEWNIFDSGAQMIGQYTDTITINNVDLVPTVTVPSDAPSTVMSSSIPECSTSFCINDSTITIEVVGTDGDGSLIVSYEVDPRPGNAAIDPTTGVFTWAPSPDDIGLHEFTFTVTDSAGQTATAPHSIFVTLPRFDTSMSHLLLEGDEIPPLSQAFSESSLADVTFRIVSGEVTRGNTLGNFNLTQYLIDSLYTNNGTFRNFANLERDPLINPELFVNAIPFGVVESGIDDRGNRNEVEYRYIWSYTIDGIETEVSSRLSIFDIPAPPTITVPSNAPMTVIVDSPITIDVDASDIDGGTLEYSVDRTPGNAAIDPTTGVFTWTPDSTQSPGPLEFTFTVTDNTDNTDSVTHEITVVDVTPFVHTVPEGQPLTDLSSVFSHSVSGLTYRIISGEVTTGNLEGSFNLTQYLIDSLSTSDGSFNLAALPDGTVGIPFNILSDAGTGSLVYEFVWGYTIDGIETEQTAILTISDTPVSPTATVPTITVPSDALEEINIGSTVTITLRGTGDTLAYDVNPKPSNAAIDSSGVFTWTPTAMDIGLHEFTFTVTDSSSTTATAPHSIFVTIPPSSLDSTVSEGDSLTDLSSVFSFVPSDLTFRIVSGEVTTGTLRGDFNLTRYLQDSLYTNNGTFRNFAYLGSDAVNLIIPELLVNAVPSDVIESGAPNVVYDYTWSYTIDGIETEQTARLTISDTPNDPTITLLSPATIQVTNGTAVSVRLIASDPDDNEVLTFSVDPDTALGASIDSDGIFRWTPTEDHIRVHDFTFTVTDSTGRTGTTTLEITVVNSITLPDINPYNRDVNEGSTIPPLSLAVDHSGALPSGIRYDIMAPEPGRINRTAYLPQTIINSLDHSTGEFGVTFPFDTTDPGSNGQAYAFTWTYQDDNNDLVQFGAHLLVRDRPDPDASSPITVTFDPYNVVVFEQREIPSLSSVANLPNDHSPQTDSRYRIVSNGNLPQNILDALYGVPGTDNDFNARDARFNSTDGSFGIGTNSGYSAIQFPFDTTNGDDRVFTFTWRYTDGVTTYGDFDATITVVNTDQPPVIGPINFRTQIDSGEQVRFTLNGMDADDDDDIMWHITNSSVARVTGEGRDSVNPDNDPDVFTAFDHEIVYPQNTAELNEMLVGLGVTLGQSSGVFTWTPQTEHIDAIYTFEFAAYTLVPDDLATEIDESMAFQLANSKRYLIPNDLATGIDESRAFYFAERALVENTHLVRNGERVLIPNDTSTAIDESAALDNDGNPILNDPATPNIDESKAFRLADGDVRVLISNDTSTAIDESAALDNDGNPISDDLTTTEINESRAFYLAERVRIEDDPDTDIDESIITSLVRNGERVLISNDTSTAIDESIALDNDGNPILNDPATPNIDENRASRLADGDERVFIENDPDTVDIDESIAFRLIAERVPVPNDPNTPNIDESLSTVSSASTVSHQFVISEPNTPPTIAVPANAPAALYDIPALFEPDTLSFDTSLSIDLEYSDDDGDPLLEWELLNATLFTFTPNTDPTNIRTVTTHHLNVTTTVIDGTTITTTGSTTVIDGSTTLIDGTTATINGKTIAKDGSTVTIDGTIITLDGTTVAINGATATPSITTTTTRDDIARTTTTVTTTTTVINGITTNTVSTTITEPRMRNFIITGDDRTAALQSNLNPDNGTFRWTPNDGDAGNGDIAKLMRFQFNATDARGADSNIFYNLPIFSSSEILPTFDSYDEDIIEGNQTVFFSSVVTPPTLIPTGDDYTPRSADEVLNPDGPPVQNPIFLLSDSGFDRIDNVTSYADLFDVSYELVDIGGLPPSFAARFNPTIGSFLVPHDTVPLGGNPVDYTFTWRHISANATSVPLTATLTVHDSGLPEIRLYNEVTSEGALIPSFFNPADPLIRYNPPLNSDPVIVLEEIHDLNVDIQILPDFTLPNPAIPLPPNTRVLPDYIIDSLNSSNGYFDTTVSFPYDLIGDADADGDGDVDENDVITYLFAWTYEDDNTRGSLDPNEPLVNYTGRLIVRNGNEPPVIEPSNTFTDACLQIIDDQIVFIKRTEETVNGEIVITFSTVERSDLTLVDSVCETVEDIPEIVEGIPTQVIAGDHFINEVTPIEPITFTLTASDPDGSDSDLSWRISNTTEVIANIGEGRPSTNPANDPAIVTAHNLDLEIVRHDDDYLGATLDPTIGATTTFTWTPTIDMIDRTFIFEFELNDLPGLLPGFGTRDTNGDLIPGSTIRGVTGTDFVSYAFNILERNDPPIIEPLSSDVTRLIELSETFVGQPIQLDLVANDPEDRGVTWSLDYVVTTFTEGLIEKTVFTLDDNGTPGDTSDDRNVPARHPDGTIITEQVFGAIPTIRNDIPVDAVIAPDTGVFTWTPGSEHSNALVDFTFTATDSDLLSSTLSHALTVFDPVFTTYDMAVVEGQIVPSLGEAVSYPFGLEPTSFDLRFEIRSGGTLPDHIRNSLYANNGSFGNIDTNVLGGSLANTFPVTTIADNTKGDFTISTTRDEFGRSNTVAVFETPKEIEIFDFTFRYHIGDTFYDRPSQVRVSNDDGSVFAHPDDPEYVGPNPRLPEFGEYRATVFESDVDEVVFLVTLPDGTLFTDSTGRIIMLRDGTYITYPPNTPFTDSDGRFIPHPDSVIVDPQSFSLDGTVLPYVRAPDGGIISAIPPLSDAVTNRPENPIPTGVQYRILPPVELTREQQAVLDSDPTAFAIIANLTRDDRSDVIDGLDDTGHFAVPFPLDTVDPPGPGETVRDAAKVFFFIWEYSDEHGGVSRGQPAFITVLHRNERPVIDIPTETLTEERLTQLIEALNLVTSTFDLRFNEPGTRVNPDTGRVRPAPSILLDNPTFVVGEDLTSIQLEPSTVTLPDGTVKSFSYIPGNFSAGETVSFTLEGFDPDNNADLEWSVETNVTSFIDDANIGNDGIDNVNARWFSTVDDVDARIDQNSGVFTWAPGPEHVQRTMPVDDGLFEHRNAAITFTFYLSEPRNIPAGVDPEADCTLSPPDTTDTLPPASTSRQCPDGGARSEPVSVAFVIPNRAPVIDTVSSVSITRDVLVCPALQDEERDPSGVCTTETVSNDPALITQDVLVCPTLQNGDRDPSGVCTTETVSSDNISVTRNILVCETLENGARDPRGECETKAVSITQDVLVCPTLENGDPDPSGVCTTETVSVPRDVLTCPTLENGDRDPSGVCTTEIGTFVEGPTKIQVIGPDVLPDMLNANELVAFTLSGSDLDGHTLTWSVTSDPPTDGTIDADSGRFSWTPTQADINNGVRFEFLLTDQYGVESDPVYHEFTTPNRAPTIDPISDTVNTEPRVDELVEFTLRGSDPDGDELTWRIGDIRSATQLAEKSVLLIQPPSAPGDSAVIITNPTPRDIGGFFLSAAEKESLYQYILSYNADSALYNGRGIDQVVYAAGTAITLPDNSDIIIRLAGVFASLGVDDSGATFDEGTQAFSWTPRLQDHDTILQFKFGVTDSRTYSDDPSRIQNFTSSIFTTISQNFTVPHLIKLPSAFEDSDRTKSVDEPFRFVFEPIVADPTGFKFGLLTNSCDQVGASGIDADTGVFTWTPAPTDGGAICQVAISLTAPPTDPNDPETSFVATRIFALFVNPHIPFSPYELTVSEGADLPSLSRAAADVGDDLYVYDIIGGNLPTYITDSFDTASGDFSATFRHDTTNPEGSKTNPVGPKTYTFTYTVGNPGIVYVLDENGDIISDILLDEDNPVLDEEGNPVLDEDNPVLDEEGNPVLDEEGNPVLNPALNPVLDEDGNPVTRLRTAFTTDLPDRTCQTFDTRSGLCDNIESPNDVPRQLPGVRAPEISTQSGIITVIDSDDDLVTGTNDLAILLPDPFRFTLERQANVGDPFNFTFTPVNTITRDAQWFLENDDCNIDTANILGGKFSWIPTVEDEGKICHITLVLYDDLSVDTSVLRTCVDPNDPVRESCEIIQNTTDTRAVLAEQRCNGASYDSSESCKIRVDAVLSEPICRDVSFKTVEICTDVIEGTLIDGVPQSPYTIREQCVTIEESFADRCHDQIVGSPEFTERSRNTAVDFNIMVPPTGSAAQTNPLVLGVTNVAGDGLLHLPLSAEELPPGLPAFNTARAMGPDDNPVLVRDILLNVVEFQFEACEPSSATLCPPRNYDSSNGEFNIQLVPVMNTDTDVSLNADDVSFEIISVVHDGMIIDNFGTPPLNPDTTVPRLGVSIPSPGITISPSAASLSDLELPIGLGFADEVFGVLSWPTPPHSLSGESFEIQIRVTDDASGEVLDAILFVTVVDNLEPKLKFASRLQPNTLMFPDELQSDDNPVGTDSPFVSVIDANPNPPIKMDCIRLNATTYIDALQRERSSGMVMDIDGTVISNGDFLPLGYNYIACDVIDDGLNIDFEIGRVLVAYGSGGGSNEWKKKPTFGQSWEVSSSQLVTDGFTFNGYTLDITDNWHTDFTRTSSIIGETNSVAMKAYAADGFRYVTLSLGVPEIGEASDAETDIILMLNRNYDNPNDYDITEIIHEQKESLVDESKTTATVSKVECSPGSKLDCHSFGIDFKVNAPLKSDVMAISAVDSKRRSTVTYVNEGVEFTGDSLLAPSTYSIVQKKTNQGPAEIVTLTQQDRRYNIWEDDSGYLWTQNDHGSWFSITAPEMERFTDGAVNVMTRMHSNFGKLMDHEEQKATAIFNASKLVSVPGQTFSYDYLGEKDEVSKMVKLAEELHIEQGKAQKIMELLK